MRNKKSKTAVIEIRVDVRDLAMIDELFKTNDIHATSKSNLGSIAISAFADILQRKYNLKKPTTEIAHNYMTQKYGTMNRGGRNAQTLTDKLVEEDNLTNIARQTMEELSNE